MKTEKFGLPGSVTVVGLVYLLALAFTPTASRSAPSGQTAFDAPAAVPGKGGNAVCPYLAHAEYAIERLMEAHHGKRGEQAEFPVAPRPGPGRLTIF